VTLRGLPRRTIIPSANAQIGSLKATSLQRSGVMKRPVFIVHRPAATPGSMSANSTLRVSISSTPMRLSTSLASSTSEPVARPSMSVAKGGSSI
jgi:hypothetical protein